MSTALTIHTEPARPMTRQADPIPAMSFDEMMRMGDDLVSTGFLPAHFKNGAQVAAVVMTGRELGMQPMRAIRSLSLVKGKVVEAADSQLARFKADGGRAVFTTLDETAAVLALRHPNGDEHTESFTMDDAKAAGLTGSENYRKFPKAMLRSRAITAGLKSVGWEGAVGNYDPDEAASFSDDRGTAEKWAAPRPAAPVVDTIADEPLTLAIALIETLPGAANNPKVWGGKGGVALSQLKPALLRSVIAWLESDADRAAKFSRLHGAARLVLEWREVELKAHNAAVAVGAAEPLPIDDDEADA